MRRRSKSQNAPLLSTDVMSDNLRRHNSVNGDDVILKFCQFTSLHRAYLLVKFYDDRRSRACWTKSSPFEIELVLEIAWVLKRILLNELEKIELEVSIPKCLNFLIDHLITLLGKNKKASKKNSDSIKTIQYEANKEIKKKIWAWQ